jgi:hypothetical protein
MASFICCSSLQSWRGIRRGHRMWGRRRHCAAAPLPPHLLNRRRLSLVVPHLHVLPVSWLGLTHVCAADSQAPLQRPCRVARVAVPSHGGLVVSLSVHAEPPVIRRTSSAFACLRAIACRGLALAPHAPQLRATQTTCAGSLPCISTPVHIQRLGPFVSAPAEPRPPPAPRPSRPRSTHRRAPSRATCSCPVPAPASACATPHSHSS